MSEANHKEAFCTNQKSAVSTSMGVAWVEVPIKKEAAPEGRSVTERARGAGPVKEFTGGANTGEVSRWARATVQAISKRGNMKWPRVIICFNSFRILSSCRHPQVVPRQLNTWRHQN